MSRPSTIGRSTANLHPPSLIHTLHTHHTFQNASSRTFTLWIHDPDVASTLSKREAVLNYDLFPPGVAKPGDIAEVRLIPPPSASNPTSDTVNDGASLAAGADGGQRIDRIGSYAASSFEAGPDQRSAAGALGGNATEEDEGRFLFVIRELEESQRKTANLQISLATHVASLFGFHSRATVRVTIVDKPLHEASHVEIYFRDQYITRSDMWRMTASLLSDTCPYNGMKLLFLGSIRAVVGNVWVRGEKVRSAYFSPRTIPIFRSESARYVIFIQMSREMWQFDTDDGGEGDGRNSGDPTAGGIGGVGGEIVFNKLINGFLPELFKRWRRINSHHIVSIILFTRIVYEHGEPVGVLGGSGHECDEFLGTPGGIEIGEGRRYRDFFRVVVSSMGSADWTVILHRLKREFAVFLRDVLVQPVPDDDLVEPIDPTPSASYAMSMASRPGTPAVTPADSLRPQTASTGQPSPRMRPTKPKPPLPRKTIITGRPSAAMHGNILEAINLATLQFSRDYVDRDLVRTGISVILVTPGTGHFEVDYEMLRATTDGLIANGMGIDLVCLSKVPLHTVPLFRYRNPIVTSTLGKEHDEPARPGLSPPKQPVPGAPAPGEWVYAVPHWIDISFWSSASEKKTRRPREANRAIQSKKDSKVVKRKHLGFRARCKMHELQMMGIVENEISCISIPFLHENPMWKPLPTETYSYGHHASINKNDQKEMEAERKRREKYKEAFKWMEEYDDAAFRPLPKLKEALERAQKRRNGDDEKTIETKLEEDDPLLGTSYHGESSQRGKGSTAYFDRKMRERQLDSSQQDAAPPPSDVEKEARSSGFFRPGKLARQFSFNIRSWGIPKATARVGPSTDMAASGTITSPGPMTTVGPGGVMVTRGFDTAGAASPRSPLSPKGTIRDSNRELGRCDETSEKADSLARPCSRPISIFNKNTATSALEAAAREKDRRRNVVGSPLDGRGPGGLQAREILKAASSLARPAAIRSDLVANADKTATIPPTVSPTSALAPWVQILNPSNPKKNPPTFVSQFRRWHHIFPKPIRTATVKWKSLCSPAALPLTTEHFPTAEQLANEYQEHTYVIAQYEDYEDTVLESPGTREELVRAMIALRLAQGFQIVVGSPVAEATAGRGGDTGIFENGFMVRAMSSCFMSRGSQIHQLICDEEYNVEVKRYVRKPMTAITNVHPGRSDEYTSYIKTIMGDHYLPIKATFRQATNEYNWNYADQFIAGYEDDLTEGLRYWRARFVLIPNDPPDSARRSQGQGYPTELNDEEIRLEGIRRLTMLFQRNRYIPPEERHYERYGRRKAKEKNPLQIFYKTVDPSVAVAQELETLSLPDIDGQMRRSQLLTTEIFDAKELDIKAIAQELQGPRGVRLQDRRWHLKLHTNCFIGEEMVTWILENFKNIATRQDAEAVGLKLFKEGLFQHVDKRHEFRDGNFFFRIAEAYANPARPSSSKGSWFGGAFKMDKTLASTPSLTESATTSPHMLHRSRSRSSSLLTDDSLSSGGDGNKTPTGPASSSTATATAKKAKAEVELSKMMKFDVDPGRKSYRPEVINLHYDRLHNPDNCYHIRLEWMNTTAKLIEDCLTSWARTVDRYGLKLVEAPIDEVCAVTKANLFRAPVEVKLAVQPPAPPSPASAISTQASPIIENMEMSTILTPLAPAAGRASPSLPQTTTTTTSLMQPPDRHYYHKALLRRFGFVLDTEAAKSFPPDVKVRYSWGTPNYTYSQYIHRSGVIFAQIADDCPSTSASASAAASAAASASANTASSCVNNSTGDGGSGGEKEKGAASSTIIDPPRFLLLANRAYTLRVGSIHHRNLGAATASCPSTTSFPTAALGTEHTHTPDSIKEEFVRFCSDEDALRRFYAELAPQNLHDPQDSQEPRDLQELSPEQQQQQQQQPSRTGTPLRPLDRQRSEESVDLRRFEDFAFPTSSRAASRAGSRADSGRMGVGGGGVAPGDDARWVSPSPVLQPVGWGSPTVAASGVAGVGRTVSVSGRSGSGSAGGGKAGGTGSAAEEEVPGEFSLGTSLLGR